MPTKKKLEKKVEELEKRKRESRKSMREQKTNVAKVLEELENEIDVEELLKEHQEKIDQLKNMSIEEMGEYLEYREKHLENEGADGSLEERTFEEIIEELEDELEKAQKLEDMYEKLKSEGCFSVETFKEKAEEQNIDGNLIFEWLERERLLLEMFGKERDTK